MGRNAWAVWLVLSLVAAGGAPAVLMAARRGPGASSDSAHYVAAARSLAEGRGYTERDGFGRYAPVTHWPPLYPAALALPALAGADPLWAAPALGSALFALTLLLIGRMVYRRTGGSLPAALFAALAALSVVDMFRIHVMVWSEPLYIPLALLALYALARHLDAPARRWLIVAALSAGAAFMTRYAGLALVAAGSLALLLWRSGAWRRRLMDGVLFGAGACLPMALWMGRNLAVGGTGANRAFSPRPVGAAQWLQGWHSLSAWLLPAGISHGLSYVAVAALIAGAATCAVLVARNRTDPAREQGPQPAPLARLLPLMLLLMAMHACVLLGAMVLTSSPPDLGTRFLAPAFPAFLVVVVCAVHDQLRAARRPAAAVAVLALVCAVFVGTNLFYTARWARRSQLGGVGLLGPSWRASDLVARVAALPPGVPVYSNRGEAIYILTGRSVSRTPRADDPEAARRDLDAMRRALREDGAVVAWFSGEERPYLLSEEGLKAALFLRPILQAQDGTLYAWGGTEALVVTVSGSRVVEHWESRAKGHGGGH
jgi:hypothetical protein